MFYEILNLNTFNCGYFFVDECLEREAEFSVNSFMNFFINVWMDENLHVIVTRRHGFKPYGYPRCDLEEC